MLTKAALRRRPANTGTRWGWQVSSQIPLPGFSAWVSGPHFLNHLGQTGCPPSAGLSLSKPPARTWPGQTLAGPVLCL